MKDEIKVSLPLFSLLYNPAILFEVHQEPQQPKILTPAERTAERIINKRRLQQVRACGGACGRPVTPRNSDLKVHVSSLAHCVVSLDKKIYSTLSLFTQV